MAIKKFTAVLFLLCGGLMAACSSGHQAMHMDAGYATEVEAMPAYVKEVKAVYGEFDLNTAYLNNLEILIRTKGIADKEVKKHNFYWGYMGVVGDSQFTQESEKRGNFVALAVFRDYMADLAALECLKELVAGILNNWQTVSREAVLTCHRDVVYRIRTIELGEIAQLIEHRLRCEHPNSVIASKNSKTHKVNVGLLPRAQDRPDIWRLVDIWSKISRLSIENDSQQTVEDLLERVKKIVAQFEERTLLPIQYNFNMTYFLFRIEKALANFFQKRFNEAIPDQQYKIEDRESDTTYNTQYDGIHKLTPKAVIPHEQLPWWFLQTCADVSGRISVEDRKKLLDSYKYINRFTASIWSMKEKFNKRKEDILRARNSMFFPQNTPATVDAAPPSSSGAATLHTDGSSSSAHNNQYMPETVDALPSPSGAATLHTDRPSSSGSSLNNEAEEELVAFIAKEPDRKIARMDASAFNQLKKRIKKNIAKSIEAANFLTAVFTGSSAKRVGEKDFAAFLKAVEGVKIRRKGGNYVEINPKHGIKEKTYWVPNISSEEAFAHQMAAKSKYSRGTCTVHLVHGNDSYYSNTVLHTIIKVHLTERGYDELYAELKAEWESK